MKDVILKCWNKNDKRCVISSEEICLDKFRSREILPFFCNNINSKISPLRSFLALVEMTRSFILRLPQFSLLKITPKNEKSFT
jgi:hypothetical protein